MGYYGIRVAIESNRSRYRILGNHLNCFHNRSVVPGHINLAMGGKETCIFIFHGKDTAAFNRY